MARFTRLFAAVFPSFFLLFQFLVLGLPLEFKDIIQAIVSLVVYVSDISEPGSSQERKTTGF